MKMRKFKTFFLWACPIAAIAIVAVAFLSKARPDDQDASPALLSSHEGEPPQPQKEEGLKEIGVNQDPVPVPGVNQQELQRCLEMDDPGYLDAYYIVQYADIPTSLKWVDGLKHSDVREGALGKIGVRLAKEDLALAKKWVLSLEQTPLSSPAVSGVARIWAESNPVEAIEWGRAMMGTKFLQDQVFVVSMGEWAKLNVSEALNYLSENLAKNTLGSRDMAIAGIYMASRLFESNRLDDLKALAAFQFPVAQSADISQKIVSLLSRNGSVEEASAWVHSLPENSLESQYAAKELTDNWVRSDSLAASEWVSKLPDGKTKDSAVSRLVNGIYSDSPGEAMTWATVISDRNLRLQALSTIVPRYMAIDREEALRAIDSLKLPPEDMKDSGLSDFVHAPQ